MKEEDIDKSYEDMISNIKSMSTNTAKVISPKQVTNKVYDVLSQLVGRDQRQYLEVNPKLNKETNKLSVEAGNLFTLLCMNGIKTDYEDIESLKEYVFANKTYSYYDIPKVTDNDIRQETINSNKSST